MLVLVFLSCQTKPRGLPEGVVEAFKKIHSKVYDVYGLSGKDDIHSHLSEIYTGEALTEAYVLHFQTLSRMTEEETEIDVKNVDYSNVSFVEHLWEGIRLDVDWSVGGIVTHQKHKHTRVNRYQAMYTLSETDGEWRILHTRVRNAERVQRAFLSDESFFNGEDAGGGYLDPMDLIDGGLLEVSP
jgi:hypothetical protein